MIAWSDRDGEQITIGDTCWLMQKAGQDRLCDPRVRVKIVGMSLGGNPIVQGLDDRRMLLFHEKQQNHVVTTFPTDLCKIQSRVPSVSREEWAAIKDLLDAIKEFLEDHVS